MPNKALTLRFLLGNLLLPKLQKAADKGEDARMLSVLAAGKGGTIDMDDLGLKENPSLKKKADYATTYNDLMVEVSAYLSLFLFLQRNLQFVIQSFLSHMLIQELSIRTFPTVSLSTFVYRIILCRFLSHVVLCYSCLWQLA